MSSIELRRLNAYPEFRNMNTIQDVIIYVNSLNHLPIVLPANLNNRQIQRFIQKFGNGDWRVQNNNRLFYNPPTNGQVGMGRVNLEVASPIIAQKEILMNAIYNNRGQGLGLGLNQFYYQVSKQFLNIKKDETADFLRRKGDWQVSRPIKKTLNHPILASCPNEKWQIDCIDLNQYVTPNNRRYIMTCVDVFSKKVFARGIANQTSNTCMLALQHIMNTSNTTPHIIQTDGGASFLQNFHNLLLQQNITHVITRSHTPSQNSIVERMNAEIRKKIRAVLVSRNNITWSQFLQDFCDNINSQKSSSTGFTPDELWIQGYNPQVVPLNPHIVINDRSSFADIREKGQAKQFNRAITALQRQRVNHFVVGDEVRVKIETFNAEMRRRNKEKSDVKYNAVTYTPQVFRIHQVIAGNIPVYPIPLGQNTSDIYNPKYIIESLVGVVVRVNNDPNQAPKLFYGSDSIIVPPNSTPNHISGVPFGYSQFGRARMINRFPAPYN